MLQGQLTPPRGPSSVPPSPPGGGASLQSPHGLYAGDFSDFTRAVRIAYIEPVCATGPSGAWALRQQAEGYLIGLKQHPQLWQFACSVLCRDHTTFNHAEMFWCCGALVERIDQGQYMSLPDEEKAGFERTLMGWVQGVCPHIDLTSEGTRYVGSKFAQLMVKTLQQAYPHRWGTFFDELFALLDLGENVIRMWLRILHAIDEVIVDRDSRGQHTALVRERDTAIKDAMRATCIPRTVATWFFIFSTFESSRPDICVLCMTAMCPFIEWIDISLVSTEQWVNMFYVFLGRPELREQSMECLLTLCEKKISDPNAKLELLARLRVTDAMPNVVGKLLLQHQAPLQAGLDDFEGAAFLMRTGELVQGVGIQLADVVNSLIPGGSTPALQTAMQMLDACLPMMWQLLVNGHPSLSLTVCEHFTRRYIELLKRQESLSRRQLQTVLGVLRQRLQYHPNVEALNRERGSDYEVQVEALRKQLLIVFRNICALERSGSCSFVWDLVKAMLEARGQAQWYEVEAVLRLFYTLGEELGGTLTQAFRNQGESPLPLIMQALLTTDLGSHEAVSLVYFDCVTRYSAFFLHQHEQRVPPLLHRLLGPFGTQHPSARVRARACGTFSSLARVLKIQLLWCIDDVIGTVQQLLSSSPDSLNERDRSALYETLGVLVQSLSSTDLPRAQLALTTLSEPLLSGLSGLAAQQPPTDAQGHTIASLIWSLAALSKGFSGISAPAVGRAPPPVLQVWDRAGKVVSSTLELYGNHPAVRDKVLLFVHRMIDLHGKGALEHVLSVLSRTLPTADLVDLAKVVRIPTQLLQRVKSEALPVVEQVFGPMMERVFTVTELAWLERIELMHTEVAREHLELLRALYMFFLQAAQPECIGVYLLPRCQALLGQVLDTVVKGCTSHPEMEIAKTCFQVLAKMVQSWVGVLDGFADTVPQQMLPAALATIRRPWFNPSDAKVSQVLNEVTALLQAVLAKVGADALGTALVQVWGAPAPQVKILLDSFQAENAKASRQFVRQFVIHLRGS